MKSTKCNKHCKIKDKRENNLLNNCKKNNKKFSSCFRIKQKPLVMYENFLLTESSLRPL